MIGSITVTAEDAEIVTLTKAKAQCRVDGTDEDTLITRLISTARRHAEKYTRWALVGKTMEYRLDRWPNCHLIELPLPPLRSVTGITYTDEDEVTATWATTEYVVDVNSTPGRIAISSDGAYPSTTLRPIAGITITATCGFIYPPGSPTIRLALPEDVEHAILMAVNRFYEHRGDDLDFTDMNATKRFLPPNFYWLLDSLRDRKF